MSLLMRLCCFSLCWLGRWFADVGWVESLNCVDLLVGLDVVA